jgi:putative transposase
MNETTRSLLGKVITIDDGRINNHLDRVVRGSVAETLNATFDAEANRLCNVTSGRRPARTLKRRLGTRLCEFAYDPNKSASSVTLEAPAEQFRARGRFWSGLRSAPDGLGSSHNSADFPRYLRPTGGEWQN